MTTSSWLAHHDISEKKKRKRVIKMRAADSIHFAPKYLKTSDRFCLPKERKRRFIQQQQQKQQKEIANNNNNHDEKKCDEGGEIVKQQRDPSIISKDNNDNQKKKKKSDFLEFKFPIDKQTEDAIKIEVMKLTMPTSLHQVACAVSESEAVEFLLNNHTNNKESKQKNKGNGIIYHSRDHFFREDPYYSQASFNNKKKKKKKNAPLSMIQPVFTKMALLREEDRSDYRDDLDDVEEGLSLQCALKKLSRTVGSIEKEIQNWEEARQILGEKIIIFPDEEESSNNEETLTKETKEKKKRFLEKHGFKSFFNLLHRKWGKDNNKKSSTATTNDTPVPAGIEKFKQIAVTNISSDQQLEELQDKLTGVKIDEAKQKRKYERTAAEIELQQKEKEAKEAASRILRPLTEEEQQIVQEAIYGRGLGTEIIASSETDSCQRDSMRKLKPGTWLNDEVIHYFLLMLTRRDEYLCAQPNSNNKKRSHFFKSFFITKLLDENGYQYRNVKRWSKRVPGKNIFNLDKIFFPVNVGAMHWCLTVIFMTDKRIQFYDSMMGSGKRYLDGLFQYLQDEHEAKLGTPLPDKDQWELVECTADTPQQCNGYDCGVFTCMFADFLSRGFPLAFSQKHITECRERIALSIMNGRALD